MFFFHLLIYICLPPLRLRIPIPARRQGDSTFSITVSRDGAWDTAKRSAHVHGATSVRTHFKACCCQHGGEEWGWNSLWAAQGLLPWMFALCQPLSPNCYLTKLIWILFIAEMSFPPASQFLLSSLFSQRAGSIQWDSSPSLKGWMHVAPIKMAELSPVNCNGTCNVQSISVPLAFSEGLFW